MSSMSISSVGAVGSAAGGAVAGTGLHVTAGSPVVPSRQSLPATSASVSRSPQPHVSRVASGGVQDAHHTGLAIGAQPTPSDAARVAVFSFDPQRSSERRMSMTDLKEGGDVVARVAFANGQRVDQFLRERFNRDGWDGKGGRLQLVVHATDDSGSAGMNNAYWDRDQGKIYLGDGDGRIFAPLGGSLDVLTHETIHAVVDSEVNLRYEGQQGGINESWADVLGSLADPDKDWLIGEDVYTPGNANDAIRNLAQPRFSNVKQIPPGGQVGVHDLSGVPSLAAVRVADRIGRDAMGQIWYRALTEHLDSRAGFSGAARATLEAAIDLYGRDSNQFAAVMDAWKSVGVNPRFTKTTS